MVAATVGVVLLAAGVVAVRLPTEDGPPPSRVAVAANASPNPTMTTAPGSPVASDAPSPSMPTATSSVCVPLRQHTHLSVVTFNIHSARSQDRTVDLARIVDALVEWSPDVVLLQEVDRGRLWTGRVDMPAVLGHRLGMDRTFGVNLRRSAVNQYGTAILSRYPILRARNLLLPAPSGTQQRGLLHATIDANGLLLSVYGTHLENTSAAARLQQIRAIEPILAADPWPVIFGGDLNASPTSKVVATARSQLTDTWRSVGRGPGSTAPARAPRTRIDYLLYRGAPGAEIEPLRARVRPRVVSDHLAVQATYRMSTKTTRVCVPEL